MGEKGFYSVVKGCKGAYRGVQSCTVVYKECCKGDVKGFEGVYIGVQWCTLVYSGVQWYKQWEIQFWNGQTHRQTETQVHVLSCAFAAKKFLILPYTSWSIHYEKWSDHSSVWVISSRLVWATRGLSQLWAPGGHWRSARMIFSHRNRQPLSATDFLRRNSSVSRSLTSIAGSFCWFEYRAWILKPLEETLKRLAKLVKCWLDQYISRCLL